MRVSAEHTLAPRRLSVALIAPFLAASTLAACGAESAHNAPPSATALADTSPSTPMPSSPAATPTKTPSATKTPESTPSATNKPGLLGCAPYTDLDRYTNHEYEVCTAYVANSAQIALQGFYKYGNSRIGYLADAARHHFETRYWEQPRQSIEQRVDAWPKTSSATGNKVEESILVHGVSSSLSADKGYIRAQESWQVTSPRGESLYTQPEQQVEATLCRGKLPGHILHEWVVVSYAHEPNLDCRAFDTAHGLAP